PGAPGGPAQGGSGPGAGTPPRSRRARRSACASASSRAFASSPVDTVDPTRRTAMSPSTSRRRFLGASAALAACGLAPELARAQAAKLVGNTYPGVYEELFRNVFGPALRKQGIDPTWSPILVVDVVA